MAANAPRNQVHVLSCRVTALAIQRSMHTNQRKTGGIVHPAEVYFINPLSGSVALAAVARELAAMYVGVAVDTLGWRFDKNQRCVAINTLHTLVFADERKRRHRFMRETAVLL